MVRNFSEKSEKLKIMLNHNGWEFSHETLAGKLRLQEYKSTLPSHPTPSLTPHSFPHIYKSCGAPKYITEKYLNSSQFDHSKISI